MISAAVASTMSQLAGSDNEYEGEEKNNPAKKIFNRFH